MKDTIWITLDQLSIVNLLLNKIQASPLKTYKIKGEKWTTRPIFFNTLDNIYET